MLTVEGAGTMFPAQALATFNLLLSVETRALDAQVQKAIQQTVASAAQHGVLRSGRALVLVSQDAANSIPVRAAVALRLFIRTIAAHGLRIDDELRPAAFALLGATIQEEGRRLTNTVVASAPFRAGLGGPAETAALACLQISVEMELDRLRGELELLAEAAKQAPATSNQVSPVMTFHGPVGFVQTGQGSFGSAHQHIDSGAREALEKALSKVTAALDNLDHGSAPFDIDDVRELVRESTEELGKAKPNASKVKALVSGIGAAITYAPKLKDAYDALNWAAALVGIHF